MKPSGTIAPKKKYEPILPGPKEWPVVLLSKNRKRFIHEVTEETVSHIKKITGNYNALKEELEQTRYKEKLRISQNPWKVDPEDELTFWGHVKSVLVGISNENGRDNKAAIEQILRDIISRYSQEIAGNFRPSSYKFARALATFGFARLLNAARVKGFRSIWSREFTLQDKINITGETEHVRKLARIGTVVMVPTHFSNLDSVLIGWVIHTLGMPPFIYGAGLNLFNISVFAYFMNSLGAYKVDRRKKNMLYLETLKTYSSKAIKTGCHSLFFPGGTRSRSGKIERKLKTGLLSTAMEAQRQNFQEHTEGKARKIFIVPVVLNYHFVLEAPALINEYLKLKGQERYYVENDEYTNSYKIIKFLLKFFTKGSDISVSIGRGMDILGNYVDDKGNSIDNQGRYINTRDYFTSNDHITKDKQRDYVYTQMLSKKIVEEYHKINRVFSSHLVAFTAFQMLKGHYKKLDLYNFLRIPEDEQVIPYVEFRNKFELLRNEILQLYKEGKVKVAPHLHDDIDAVIDHGLLNVGLYHAKRPLLKNKQGDIISEDLGILFYYHNRMDGYDLERFF